MNVNRYQFDNIVSKTKKSISPIQKNTEEKLYSDYLERIEGHLFHFYTHNGITGRQAKEILQVILFDIKSILDNETYDTSRWQEENYRRYANSIESLFIPEKNPELQELLLDSAKLNSDYFELAQKCIVRIYESIEYWTKEYGSEGYFSFLSDFMTDLLPEGFVVEDRFLK